MKIYRVEYSRTYNTKYSTVEAKSKSDAITKAIEDNNWIEYPILSQNPTYNYVANEVKHKTKEYYPEWISVKDSLPPVDKEAIVLTKDGEICFGHIVDKKIAKSYNGWNIPDVEYWLPFVNPKDK